jgi:sugar lactone lactonase YvrE
LEGLEGRLCPVLALTPASISAGYAISTFATDFTDQLGFGALSVLFRDQGGELVTEMGGSVRLFSADSDGQSAVYVQTAQTFDASDAIALAKVGSTIYMTQQSSGNVVQLNATGNFVSNVVSVPGATGIAANPKNGHLFVDDDSYNIYDVDPQAHTEKQLEAGVADYGLAVSADGKIVYAAGSDTHVMGYDTSSGNSVFDSGPIAGNPEGLALGTGRFAGNLYVSTNDGQLVDINLASRSQTVIANGGVRGDFLTFDPNDGSLLVTQTDRIVRVKFPTGQAVSFQITAASSILPGQPFVATVTAVDADGRVVPNYTGTVKFSSSDPYPGLLPPQYTFTAGDNSTHNFAVVFFTAGTQTLSVQDTASSSLNGTAQVTVPAGAATHIELAAPSTTVAGSPFDVTVAAIDAYGNPDPNYSGTVMFTSTDSASGSVVPANYTFVAADKGMHTFSSGVTLLTAGPRTITVADKSNGSFTASANLVVTPAAASHLVLMAPSSAVAGAPFDVTVAVFDAYGNAASNYTDTVTFRSTDTHPGVLPSDYTFSSADQGTHTFTGVTLFTARPQMLTAQDTANSSLAATDPVAVSPAAVSEFMISAPSSIGARNPFSITVTAFDAYGNLATNYAGVVTFASSDSSALLPADYGYTAGDSGTHNFGVVFFMPGDQTLIVTDKASGISGSVMVTVVSPGGNAESTSPGGQKPASAGAGLSLNEHTVVLDWFFASRRK